MGRIRIKMLPGKERYHPTIVEKLRPQWKQDDVKIERIFGGFLNRTFSCLQKSDLQKLEDGLFVR